MSAMINGLEYKIGVHGKVFLFLNGGWLLSTKEPRQYLFEVRQKDLMSALRMVKQNTMPVDHFKNVFDEAETIIDLMIDKGFMTKHTKLGAGDKEFLSVPQKVRPSDQEFAIKKMAARWPL